jgi:hypothetical protein
MPNAKAMWIHGELKAYVVEADDVMLSIVFEEFDRNASRLHILDWSLTTEGTFLFLRPGFSSAIRLFLGICLPAFL